MRTVTLPALLDLVVADAVVGVGAAVAGSGFGPGAIGGGGGGLLGQGPVRAFGVVGAGERVEQGLELGGRGGLRVLGAEPFLGRLLEPLDLALGLWMVRLAVFLGDAEAAELGFQAVAAALAAGEPGGEDHPLSVKVEAGAP